MDEYINPDILEILLSEIHQMSYVLNGLLTSTLRYVTETHYGGASYYNMERIFKHGSLQALDPELLKPIYHKLYTPDDEWKNAITNAPNKLRIRGVNIEFVKYSHIDFNLLEYNNNLYTRLYKQTNSFDPVELGKRVVFVPQNVPTNFDDVIKVYEPLTRDFKIIAKYLKDNFNIETPIEDSQTMNDILAYEYPSTPIKDIKQRIVAAMDEMAELAGQKDESGLTMAMLEKYREKFEACITVTPEHNRLYTRARFILNMFRDLNGYLIEYVVEHAKTGDTDTVSRVNEYLGMNASHILTHFHKLYTDHDNYPVFSNLYLFGSIENRPFPESSIYTNIQRLCFCEWCKPFLYTAQIYEANTGDIYILVSLKVEPSELVKFLISKKCHFNLFISDINYHYKRLASLDDWRTTVETQLHKNFDFNMEYVHKNYGQFYHNWFSSSYTVQRCILNAERIIETVQDGY